MKTILALLMMFQVTNATTTTVQVPSQNIQVTIPAQTIQLPAQPAVAAPNLSLFPVKLCQGSIDLGTLPIASAQSVVVSTGCLGLTTNDVVSSSSNGTLFNVVGYVPSTKGILTIHVYPSANEVNVEIANNTQASITPGPVTLNYIVVK